MSKSLKKEEVLIVNAASILPTKQKYKQMKQLTASAVVIILVLISACSGRTDREGTGRNKVSHVPDTGYTGVKNYIKDNIKLREVYYRNGVREGMTRTFYKGGALEQEIPYSADRKNGEAKWYYPDGKLFRLTPYLNDTIHGEQVQYYKSGRVKAILKYSDGKRLPGIEEYLMSGEKVSDYPELRYRVNDRYDERGLYKIFIEFSDMAENGKFYRGDYAGGLVDIDSLDLLLQTATTGYLDLQKTPGHRADSVVVVASYLTRFGNRLFYRLAIPLPYKDLN
jgi:antitoxin component YwqK of YwqJK toxin-antitoxin module